jgi:hypothetical protein
MVTGKKKVKKEIEYTYKKRTELNKETGKTGTVEVKTTATQKQKPQALDHKKNAKVVRKLAKGKSPKTKPGLFPGGTFRKKGN